jgi:hypothetical protein
MLIDGYENNTRKSRGADGKAFLKRREGIGWEAETLRASIIKLRNPAVDEVATNIEELKTGIENRCRPCRFRAKAKNT